MWRKQCSLWLTVRGEDKASRPSQRVSIQEILWWPLLICHHLCPVGATGAHQTPPRMPHKPHYLSGDPISTPAPHHSCMVGPGLWAAQIDKVVNRNALLILQGNKGVVQVTALKKHFTKSSLCRMAAHAL